MGDGRNPSFTSARFKAAHDGAMIGERRCSRMIVTISDAKFWIARPQKQVVDPPPPRHPAE